MRTIIKSTPIYPEQPLLRLNVTTDTNFFTVTNNDPMTPMLWATVTNKKDPEYKIVNIHCTTCYEGRIMDDAHPLMFIGQVRYRDILYFIFEGASIPIIPKL